MRTLTVGRRTLHQNSIPGWKPAAGVPEEKNNKVYDGGQHRLRDSKALCVVNIAIIRRQRAKTKGMLVGRWLRRSNRDDSRQRRKLHPCLWPALPNSMYRPPIR
jgi:hypothetical protein